MLSRPYFALSSFLFPLSGCPFLFPSRLFFSLPAWRTHIMQAAAFRYGGSCMQSLHDDPSRQAARRRSKGVLPLGLFGACLGVIGWVFFFLFRLSPVCVFFIAYEFVGEAVSLIANGFARKSKQHIHDFPLFSKEDLVVCHCLHRRHHHTKTARSEKNKWDRDEKKKRREKKKKRERDEYPDWKSRCDDRPKLSFSSTPSRTTQIA